MVSGNLIEGVCSATLFRDALQAAGHGLDVLAPPLRFDFARAEVRPGL
jgi:hypothetical protein